MWSIISWWLWIVSKAVFRHEIKCLKNRVQTFPGVCLSHIRDAAADCLVRSVHNNREMPRHDVEIQPLSPKVVESRPYKLKTWSASPTCMALLFHPEIFVFLQFQNKPLTCLRAGTVKPLQKNVWTSLQTNIQTHITKHFNFKYCSVSIWNMRKATC